MATTNKSKWDNKKEMEILKDRFKKTGKLKIGSHGVTASMKGGEGDEQKLLRPITKGVNSAIQGTKKGIKSAATKVSGNLGKSASTENRRVSAAQSTRKRTDNVSKTKTKKKDY